MLYLSTVSSVVQRTMNNPAKSIIIYLWFVVIAAHNAWGYLEDRTFQERSKVFCRLKKECQLYQEYENDYNKLFNLSEISNVQPDGFLVRLPFYILADRDAHIIFTETDDPDWQADNAYEIVIGGWENYRTTIRRKRDDMEIKFEYSNHVLTSACPLKALIEITTAGDIRIFIEHKIVSVLEARDANPLPIKYVGFASLQHSLAEYFYGCKGEDIYTSNELKSNCTMYETKDNSFKDFYPLTSKMQRKYATSDYTLNTLFYVEARRSVRVSLSKDNRLSDGYEIVIGRHVEIYKRTGSDMEKLADFPGSNMIKSNRHLTTMIQISKNGVIKVLAKHDHTQFKLLAHSEDKSPHRKLKFISFSASEDKSIARVFFDCQFDYPFIDLDVATKYTSIGHPLLDDPEFKTLADKRNWLVSKCKYYTNPEYKYKDFVKLRDIPGSQPNGYAARVVFYAQGTRNAHVVLSATDRPDFQRDYMYEFVIGGWVNSRVLIRRKKSDEVMSQVFVFNTMTPHTPTKFVLEVANSGNVRIYSDHDKSQPIAAAFDPHPLPVSYVSFAAYDTNVDFFYDCRI